MTLYLRAGDVRLLIDPATGGAIGALTWRGVDVLRPVRDPRLTAQRGRAVAGYPLLPYANRIAWGRFSVGNAAFQLGRNFGENPHSIHGNGWMRRWTVAETHAARARLVLDHAPPHDPVSEWPFAYHAEQVFGIVGDTVSIALSLRNTDARAFPAGIGLHPYVARTPRSTLRFDADTVWIAGADTLPARREAVQGDLEFQAGKPIGDTEIDSCFAGWGGSASVIMPEHNLALHITADPPLDHFQVYTPAGCDYCGLEPVSNMPDAINRMQSISDQGMVMLSPGDSLQARVTFEMHPI